MHTKTFTFNMREIQILTHAIEVVNDWHNDALTDELSIDLFPKEGETVTYDRKTALKVRSEIEALLNKSVALATLLEKFGIRTNEEGYVLPDPK